MDCPPPRETSRYRSSRRAKLPVAIGLLIATSTGCQGPRPGGADPARRMPQAAENRSASAVGAFERQQSAAVSSAADDLLSRSDAQSSSQSSSRGSSQGSAASESEHAAKRPSFGNLLAAEPPAANSVPVEQSDGEGSRDAADSGSQPADSVTPVQYDGPVVSETVVIADSVSPQDRSGPEQVPQPPAAGGIEEPISPSRLPAPPGDREPDQLSDLIDAALANHPRIQAARRRVAAAANEIPQARALPDPMLNNTFWPIADNALQTAAGRVGHQMGINQQVPWPSKLDSRAAVAAREVEIARAEVEEVQREIVEAVQLAYYELWLSQRALEIVEENQELVNDLKQVSEARYRTGGTQQDILRAELEADKLEEQRIELRRRVEQARADLGALVRQPVDFVPEPTMDLPKSVTRVDLMELVADAERCNPTLQGLAAEIARDMERQRLACLQKYPDFQFGIGWSLITEDDAVSPVANGHDAVNFTLGLTLPVWKEKIAAGIREAANRRASTAQLREAERDRLYAELRRLVAAAEAAIEQAELFQQRLIPRTEQTLNLATADYRGERTDFFNLIDIYQELLTYQLQLARARATLAGTIAQIERAAGCTLTPNLRAQRGESTAAPR